MGNYIIIFIYKNVIIFFNMLTSKIYLIGKDNKYYQVLVK